MKECLTLRLLTSLIHFNDAGDIGLKNIGVGPRIQSKALADLLSLNISINSYRISRQCFAQQRFAGLADARYSPFILQAQFPQNSLTYRYFLLRVSTDVEGYPPCSNDDSIYISPD